MRKRTKREEVAVENPDVSPPKKTNVKEKKAIPAVAPNRLPRAAKNRPAAQANGVENNVELAKKPRARAKPLRRSRSSDNLAPKITANLKKTKSKSAEHLDQQEDGPPSKKVKNPAVKTAKKTIAKKAGTEGKAKATKKATIEALLEDVEEEFEEEPRPLIAKKAYNRSLKKAPVVEDEEDKPKKRGAAKEPVAPAKLTRGRGKAPAANEVDEESDVDEAKQPAKVKKGKANGKKAAAALADEEEKGDAEDVGEEVAENAAEAAKPKRGGKKAAAGPKKPRNTKKPVGESVDKDNASQEKTAIEEPVVDEPHNTKAVKGGKKSKAPAAKKAVKKIPPAPKDNNNVDDEEEDGEVLTAGDDNQEATDVPQQAQKEPEENAKSAEQESNSDDESEVQTGDHDQR